MARVVAVYVSSINPSIYISDILYSQTSKYLIQAGYVQVDRLLIIKEVYSNCKHLLGIVKVKGSGSFNLINLVDL